MLVGEKGEVSWPANFKFIAQLAPAVERYPRSMILLLAILATVPFWFAQYPDLIDYPGHLARWYVMVEHGRNPWIDANYTFEWRLSGNLGTDLLAYPLIHLFGVEASGILIAALIPALTVAGILAVARALGRPNSFGTYAALPFVFHQPYLMGFLNYSLGIALALLAFAWWIRRASILPAIAISFALWLCHTAAWACFAVMVGGLELSRTRNLKTLLVRLWPAALPGVSFLFPSAPISFLTDDFWAGKVRNWLVVLGYRNFVFDVAVVAITYSTILIAARARAGFDLRAAIPAGLLFAFTFALPHYLAGGDFADMRLAPVAIILALLSIKATGPAWLRGAFLCLFLVRMADTTWHWHKTSQMLASDLRAIEYIPRGATVHTLDFEGSDLIEQSPYALVPAYATFRKDAFVNAQFATPGVHMLGLRKWAPFDAPRLFKLTDSPEVLQLANYPGSRLMWVFHPDVRVALPKHARVIYVGPNSVLYEQGPARHS